MIKTAKRTLVLFFITVCALSLTTWEARAREPLSVVASIQPVHSLVAAVMEGAGRPALLIKGVSSPHSHALRPSQARALEHAELVFWIGEPLESFLAGALDSLSSDARVVTLLKADGLVLYPPLPGDEAGAAFDPHIWLDPQNAQGIVEAVRAALAAADPERASLYARNAKKTVERLALLEAELGEILRPVRRHGFVVFHDALQYFERRFKLNRIASLVVHPDRPPSARRMARVRALLREAGGRCVFGEPQFEPSLIETVAGGTGARIGIVDPLGAGETPGVDAYFHMMRKLATAIAHCLRSQG
jgi:zinc transport system substrate-binding protein